MNFANAAFQGLYYDDLPPHLKLYFKKDIRNSWRKDFVENTIEVKLNDERSCINVFNTFPNDIFSRVPVVQKRSF